MTALIHCRKNHHSMLKSCHDLQQQAEAIEKRFNRIQNNITQRELDVSSQDHGKCRQKLSAIEYQLGMLVTPTARSFSQRWLYPGIPTISLENV